MTTRNPADRIGSAGQPPSPIPSATQFLQLEEGRIAFDRTGSGPVVLLVPGMGDLRSSYRLVVPSLAAQGYTVVTCDLRGHGDSSASFPSYGDSETAGDIVALLEHLGQPATVVGNSMAAGAAVIAAAQHPDLIPGLVLIGPFVRTPARQGPAARLALRILLAPPWAALVWRVYLPTLYAGSRPDDFADYRRAVIAAIRRPGYRTSFSLTTRTSHDAAEAALASVTASALVLMGERDPDFPDPRKEAEWIAAALHGASVMIADAGHYPQSQAPAATATAIGEFLRAGTDRAVKPPA
jgi:pimeloyl-ACP methyl ester carboxylesterase